MHKIESIYQTELEQLKSAVKDGASFYHTFTFSSFSKNYPEIRTVVLRGVEIEPLRISFNADFRSPKIQELQYNNSCSALFYDQKRRVQLRLKCKAILNYNNDLATEVWRNTPLQSRKCYMGDYAPTMLLDEWNPNIPLEYLKTDPDKELSEQGYINFSNIQLEVIESEVLQLHHDGHIRFKVSNKGEYSYIAP